MTRESNFTEPEFDQRPVLPVPSISRSLGSGPSYHAMPAMALAQVLDARTPRRAALRHRHSTVSRPPPPGTSLHVLLFPLRDQNSSTRWAALQREVRCQGRFSCLFSDGRKQEQARKALEGALGGKKTEFEKWNKEIEKRTEMGGGGTSGRGGWFGGGGWFRWFNDEHFWAEAQQAILAILGIILLFLLLTKGNVMFAFVFNSLLFVLRGPRNCFLFVSSCLPLKVSSNPATDQSVNETFQNRKSAKESVVSKWGTD